MPAKPSYIHRKIWRQLYGKLKIQFLAYYFSFPPIFSEGLSKYIPSKIPLNCSTIGDHLTMEPRGFM